MADSTSTGSADDATSPSTTSFPRLTSRQREVLLLLADAPRGLMAWQVRDRLWGEDDVAMRRYRPSRGASNWQTGAGALGNLAAGRILWALHRAGLAWQPQAMDRRVPSNRWELTIEGRRVARSLTTAPQPSEEETP